MTPPLRLVLDTNAWLDWLVFADAQIAPVRAAHLSGGVHIFIDAPCEQELQRVLAYKLRRAVLEPAEQAAALEECRRIALPCAPADAAAAMPLPLCRDADDQKFLELARAARAEFLITKDRDLLELARSKYTRTGFAILTPQAFAPCLAQRLAA